MRGRAWTPEEDAALMDACATCKTWAEVAERMPGRTKKACERHGQIIGTSPAGPQGAGRWRGYEVRALREHYPEHGPHWGGWPDVLPGRTEEQIEYKAKYEGVGHPRRTWTAEEDRLLAKLLVELVCRLDRPAVAIATHMRSLVTLGLGDAL